MEQRIVREVASMLNASLQDFARWVWDVLRGGRVALAPIPVRHGSGVRRR